MSESQLDAIVSALRDIFCKKHNKVRQESLLHLCNYIRIVYHPCLHSHSLLFFQYFDYVMRVLLPEVLIRMTMCVHDVTYDEAQRRLSSENADAVDIASQLDMSRSSNALTRSLDS